MSNLRFILVSLAVVLLLPFSTAYAALNVFATVPEWGALAQEIGGKEVRVFTATNALQDPHRIQARPSLIARARNADLIVATGAELEIGWLPLVLRETGADKIQPGQPGYFEAASVVNLLEKPARLDRAEGDVHPGGNPHIQTDPRNLLKVGSALAQRLSMLDPANAAVYQANYQKFAQRLSAAIVRWEKLAAPLRATPIIVQHKAFAYLENWLDLREVAALEPKPGVEPTSAHLAEVVELAKTAHPRLILRAAWQSDNASRWLTDKTGIPSVMLPFTVGGTPAASDLFSLYEDTIERLLAGLSASKQP